MRFKALMLVLSMNAASCAYATKALRQATSALSPPPTVALQIPLAAQLNSSSPNGTIAVLSGAFPTLEALNDDPIYEPPTIPTLRIPPAWSFSIGWSANTFNSSAPPALDSDNDGLWYWSVFTNTSDALDLPSTSAEQLPDWLYFDPNSLNFFGTTPDEGTLSSMYPSSTARNFTITMFAAPAGLDPSLPRDTNSTASATFILEISSNRLVLAEQLPPIETTIGSDVSMDFASALPNAARFVHGNGSMLRMEVDTNNQEWLQWDSNSTHLYGHVPDLGVFGKTFTLPVLITGDPQFNDSLTTSLRIDVLPYPFINTSLPDLVVYPGVPFHISLDNLTLPDTPFDNLRLSFAGDVAENGAPWLTLEDSRTGSNTLVIHGTPPTSQSVLGGVTVPLVLSATGPNNLTAAATLILRIAQHDSSHGSPYSAQSVVRKKDRLIVLGVVLPVGIASCLAGLIWWLCMRRRKERKIRSYNGTHRLSYDNMDQKSSMRYIQGFGSTTSGKSITEPEQARTPSLSPSTSSRRRSGSIHYYQDVERTNSYTPRRATGPNSIGSVLDISPAYSLQQIQEHSYEHDEHNGDSYHDHRPQNTSGRTHTPRNRHDDSDSNSDLAVERLVEDSTSTPASLAQMPSMNFGFLMSPTVNGRTPESQRVPGGQYGSTPSPNYPPSSGSLCVDPKETSPQMSTREQVKDRRRSVNSAYDSLPSFDSESTWAYERRRRPPSPTWRRDDVYRGYTLYDQLKEEEKVKAKDQEREVKAKQSSGEKGKGKGRVK